MISRHDEGQAVQFMVPEDRQLEELVNAACLRIQAELSLHAPFLAEKVSHWMAQLSPTGTAPDYFLQPRLFPFLRLPLWAAKSFAGKADHEFLADVIYSTVNGYYYIRLLDNLMDGHGTVELKLLPATAFFHAEFQVVYQKYFAADHSFWKLFRAAWFSGSNAVAHEMEMDYIDAVNFEQVTVEKLAGVRIPLAAVAFRYRAGEAWQRWEEFALALARWSQMEDDLFDWHHDLQQGKTSHFLSESDKRKGDGTVEAWVLGEGFERALEALDRELSELRRCAAPLNSPDVLHYLEARETMLAEQKKTIGEAFQTLKAIASIMEESGTLVSPL